jgi:L-asparaginase type I
MKKILILYTGGTVGMEYTNDGLRVVSGLFESQLKSLAPVANAELNLIEYETLIDSSDINLGHWVKIIEDITKHYDEYDGFVVVHGTDTMAYTASILAFALRGLSKPVILTGAQLPLVHRRSDGWFNLIDSIYAAMQPDLNEVAIVFNHKLLRGCRSQKVSTNRFSGFDSVDKEPLAEFGIDILWHKKHWLKASRYEFSPIIPKADVMVLDLSLRPGYTTNFIADTLMSTDADAIVLQTYGSGTIPMGNKCLVDAITQAAKRGILIVSVTQVREGKISNQYFNSKLSQFGVISGSDMTPEAAIAKLWVLLSGDMSKEGVAASMKTNLIGELTDDLESYGKYT